MKIYRTLIIRDGRDQIIDTIELDEDHRPTRGDVIAAVAIRHAAGARSADIIESTESTPS